MKSLLKKVLLFGALSLFALGAQALEDFEQAGLIKSVNYSGFTVDGVRYRIAPGAKLQSNDPSRKKLSDFQQGDRIYFEGKIMNGAYLVYLVVYEKPIAS